MTRDCRTFCSFCQTLANFNKSSSQIFAIINETLRKVTLCPGICGQKIFRRCIWVVYIQDKTFFWRKNNTELSEAISEKISFCDMLKLFQSVWCSWSSSKKACQRPFSKSEQRALILFKAHPRPRELQVHILFQNCFATFRWNSSLFLRQRISPTQTHSRPCRNALMLKALSVHQWIWFSKSLRIS